MHIVVFGTGAVGGMLGARLALSGQGVTFVARPAVANAMTRSGLQLLMSGETHTISAPRGVTDVSQVPRHPPSDIVLLTVKGYDCAAAAVMLRDQWPDPPPVVCLLNGVGHEATLTSALGADRVIPASLTTAVQMIGPGLIRVERERGLLLAKGHRMSTGLRSAFVSAGVTTRLCPNADAMKWSKLLTNLVGNATPAILGWPVGDVFRHPLLYRLELEAVREAVRVIRALGWSPMNLPGVPVGLLARLFFLPPALLRPILGRVVVSGRGMKRPSFHADIGRGRSEVHWINGAVVQHAEKLGLGAPANSVLTGTLLQLVYAKGLIPSDLRQPWHLLASAAAAHVPGISEV